MVGELSDRPSGNHSAISRWADSTASEPWMTLRPTLSFFANFQFFGFFFSE